VIRVDAQDVYGVLGRITLVWMPVASIAPFLSFRSMR
jgi:hypothetical protein